MKRLVLTSLCLLILGLSLRAQLGLYVGYNLSNHYNWSKGATFVEYDFNDDNVNDLQNPHEFGNLFKGLVLGYGANAENLGVDMFYIRRTISSEATKIDANNQEVYSKIRYSNNALAINVFFGWQTVKFGYGFEFGRFRRRDLTDPDGDWNKNIRNKPMAIGAKLLARIYLSDEDAPVGVILMPYWRFNGSLSEHYNNNFTREEFFKLNAFGISAVLNINLGD